LALFTLIFGEITLRFGTWHTETPSAGLILLLMKLLTLSAAAMLLIVAIISFVGNQPTWVLSLAASGASLATWFVYRKQAK
jgi:Flp pilus assembly protein TadB